MSWCASRYGDLSGSVNACDCGLAEADAKRDTLALPDQFCLKCEDAPVRLAIVKPRAEAKNQALRFFAVCFVCAHIRELEPTAVL